MNALRVRAGAGQISGVGRQTFRVYESGWEGSKLGGVGVLGQFGQLRFSRGVIPNAAVLQAERGISRASVCRRVASFQFKVTFWRDAPSCHKPEDKRPIFSPHGIVESKFKLPITDNTFTQTGKWSSPGYRCGVKGVGTVAF